MEYLLDVHTHTVASGHAYNTIMEMSRAACDKGLKLLGITEHAPLMPGSCSNLYFHNLKVVPRNMCGIELMLGVELNILDYDAHVFSDVGRHDFSDAVIQDVGFPEELIVNRSVDVFKEFIHRKNNNSK